MSANAILYYERLLAPLLGLSRDDLIYLRDEVLKKKKGACRREGREAVITQEGLDAILARLRASHNDAPIEIDFTPALVALQAQPREKTEEGAGDEVPLEKNGAAAPTTVELTVLRCYPNPRMLRALTPNGEQVDVHVKTNKNFTPRMTLKARLVTAGKYEMEGRCPRTRGRY